jgi:hypothetical protein
MKQICIQFIAKKREILHFLYEWSKKNDLIMIVGVIFPEFAIKKIDEDIEIFDAENLEFAILTKRNESLEFESYKTFIEEYKGDLVTMLGQDVENELHESSMGAISDKELNLLWKKCIGCWKKKLLKGGWVVNPEKNVRKYHKNLFYTALAQEAYRNGTKILPISGWCYYELDEI